MRIAYVSADRGIPVFGTKGASIHVRAMANAFAALGHRVSVLAPRRGDAPAQLEATVIEVGGERLANLDAAPADDPAARARRKEQRSIEVADLLAEELVRRHMAEPFDLVYERYSLFSSAGVDAARQLGIPCVVEVNAPLLDEQRRFRRLEREDEARSTARRVFAGADAVLCVSDEVRTHVLAEGGDAARTRVVPNGVDRARFNPRVTPVRPAEADGRFVVGFAGSLKPWHGIEVLMDAFRTLSAESSDYHLLVAGDGPLREWMQGYAAGAGLAERLTVTGWTPYEALPSVLRAMDVAVAPYPAMERFYFSPLKLFEYMAVGVPVVASRIGQVAEVLEDGVSGLLAPPGDAGALAQSIALLRGDPMARRRVGLAASRSPALRTWEDNARAALEVLSPAPAARSVVA